MFSSFTLLLPCLLVVLPSCHGKPFPVERLKQMIIHTSKRIQSHIEEYPISEGLTFKLPDEVPGTKSIQGLGSAIESLMAFQRIVDSLGGHTRQLSVDLDTLHSNMPSLQCPTRKPISFKGLDSFLKANQGYKATLRPAVLRRLKDYMNKLQSNLDILKTC